jgi:hypothetical protein
VTGQHPQSPAGGYGGNATRNATRVLAVGDGDAPDVGPEGAAFGDVHYLAFADVTAETLRALDPDLVLSPLVGSGFDCLDLAERLNAARFKGRYRAVVELVPNPALVRGEIAERFPALDFDLLVLEDRD